jgi:alkylated DNA repair dioxygenase AlkB
MQSNLFNPVNEETNLLPNDGEVNYFGRIFDEAKRQFFFEKLFDEIAWKNDEAFIFGKHIITKRKVAWYGDRDFSYTYSNATKNALPWTAELLELKAISEKLTNETYNSCLLNLYHDGNEGMAWHSDDEKALVTDAAIASLSFGAERKFCFKHKKAGERVDIFLENGSLLVMKGVTQINWLHRLPPTKKVKAPRINLTFRTMQG